MFPAPLLLGWFDILQVWAGRDFFTIIGKLVTKIHFTKRYPSKLQKGLLLYVTGSMKTGVSMKTKKPPKPTSKTKGSK